uniref:Uncharacterized protein n=1 Tax=Cucumis melo TaxID=3656 RepID=A0A9I9EJX7_CUCME
MQNYKRNAYTKADLQCMNAYTKEVESCFPSDANINNVAKICSAVGENKKKKNVRNGREFKPADAIHNNLNSESKGNREKKKKKQEEMPYCSVMEEKSKSQYELKGWVKRR